MGDHHVGTCPGNSSILMASKHVFHIKMYRNPYKHSKSVVRLFALLIQFESVIHWLHFAWGVAAEAKCILVMAVCMRVSIWCMYVCLSFAAFPHYCTVYLEEWQGMPPSCGLLGGLAIGARVSLLWQHSDEREISASACSRSIPGIMELSQRAPPIFRWAAITFGVGHHVSLCSIFCHVCTLRLSNHHVWNPSYHL